MLTEGREEAGVPIEEVRYAAQRAFGNVASVKEDTRATWGWTCVERLWQEHCGGSPDVIGRRVLLNAEPFLIVGVTEAEFSGASLHEPHDLQVPA